MVLVSVGLILSKLAGLSLDFQSSHVDIAASIAKTTVLIRDLETLANEQTLLAAVSEDVAQLNRKLDENGLFPDPQKRRAARPADTPVATSLTSYIHDIVVELKARFKGDNKLLSRLSTFDDPVWKIKATRVADEVGVDVEIIRKEADVIGRHIECSGLREKMTESKDQAGCWQ
ncbi:hypothetical protein Pmar_PMAR000473, partial [Perkinsus marinus ATCC 50983]